MSNRQTGGQNNKQGNRYEDFFATYQLLLFAPKHIDQAIHVRLKEQANCFVDDLVIDEPAFQHFFQLKSGAGITWGKGKGKLTKGKLEKDFRSQLSDCKTKGIRCKLVVVVSSPARKKSLESQMPHGIKTVTSIFLFPILARPSDLLNHKSIMRNTLSLISASRFSGRAAQENIVEAFYCAWIEHTPDATGYCVLADVIASIRTKNACPIRHSWQDTSGRWKTVESILRQIKGLQFWVDKGHFEWRYSRFGMDGIMSEPCASASFSRFMDRTIAAPPTTFDDFEGLLP